MIRLLIVEDSTTVIGYLEYIFSNDNDIEVVGTARNGKDAVEFVKKNKVDIITMDIDMPVMNGFQATKIIMSENPVPIIILTSSRNAKNDETSIEALASGALTILQKPFGIGHGQESIRTSNMLKMVKTFSKVKVITRKYINNIPAKKPIALSNSTNKQVKEAQLKGKKYILIGISSGGPQVLSKIFSGISDNFPLPIIVVQHITKGFINTMVSWLNSSLNLNVKIADNNEFMRPGHIYFAPDNENIGIKGNKIELTKCNLDLKICPSVKYLFESVSDRQAKDVIAMILTGMGSDGSAEIKKLKYNGAVTIAQDKQSSLVHGMPGEAIKSGGVNYILSTDEISKLFTDIARININHN